MPKTENNSHRCSCCHRLMPRKGKSKTRYCSPICRHVGEGRRRQRSASRTGGAE